MKFSKNQVIVHPHHGPATVTKVSSRTLRGERRKYLTLQTHKDDMSVSVPVDLIEEMGVRTLLDAKGVKEIFGILIDESSTFDKVWSRRFKDYTERLNSGNVRTIAGLVRDITRRNTERRVSYGEMGVLRDATGPLIAELALTLKIEHDEAVAMVDEAILEGTEPALVNKGAALAS